MSKITKSILGRIEQSWSRIKHDADPMALVVEIQFQLECSYSRALCYANEIALRLK